MTNANFKNGVYALMTEEDPNKKYLRKSMRMRHWGQAFSILHSWWCPVVQKNVYQNFCAFMYYSHFLWGSSQPTKVLTENKPETKFFQIKILPVSSNRSGIQTNEHCSRLLMMIRCRPHIKSLSPNQMSFTEHDDTGEHPNLRPPRRRPIQFPNRRWLRNRRGHLGKKQWAE